MAGAKNKHKDHQTSHRKGYYQRQRDVTPVNKAIKVARHIARFGDTKQKDVLRGMTKYVLSLAAAKLQKLYVRSGVMRNMDQHGPREVLLQLAK